MAQATFFSVYLLDTGCPARLDGKDRTPQPIEFTETERALIWDGLEGLVQSGRLKLITPVKEEMEWLYKAGLNRLAAFPEHRLIIRKSVRANVLLYQRIVGSYPDIAPKPGQREADPWLIVVAKRFNYTIVTCELHKRDRVPTQRRRMRLPDVCEAEGINWLYLRGLANHEGWLPTA